MCRPLLHLLLAFSILLPWTKTDAESPIPSAPDLQTSSVINQPIFSVRMGPQSEVETVASLVRSKDESLLKTLGWMPDEKGLIWPMKLRWNDLIVLKDGIYILCLFEFEGGTGFDDPRVLVLFDTKQKYAVKTWGKFTGGGGSFRGASTQRSKNPNFDSTFVTMNRNGRDGMIWFQKFRLNSAGIELLGQGPELTNIPEPEK